MKNFTPNAKIITHNLTYDGENDYSLALYNKPERFGVRLYGFNDEDSSEVIAILSRFKERTNRVAGVLLELLDEDKETIESIEEKFHVDFLISAASMNAWAIHPTILFATQCNIRKLGALIS